MWHLFRLDQLSPVVASLLCLSVCSFQLVWFRSTGLFSCSYQFLVWWFVFWFFFFSIALISKFKVLVCLIYVQWQIIVQRSLVCFVYVIYCGDDDQCIRWFAGQIIPGVYWNSLVLFQLITVFSYGFIISCNFIRIPHILLNCVLVTSCLYIYHVCNLFR